MMLLDLIILCISNLGKKVLLWKYFWLHCRSYSHNNCYNLSEDPVFNVWLTQCMRKKPSVHMVISSPTSTFVYKHPINQTKQCCGFFFKHLNLISSLINSAQCIPFKLDCHLTDYLLKQSILKVPRIAIVLFPIICSIILRSPTPFHARIRSSATTSKFIGLNLFKSYLY